MEKKMFCYQREQTDTAKLQDELTGALIALARPIKAPVSSSCNLAVSAFFPQTPAFPVHPAHPTVCSH